MRRIIAALCGVLMMNFVQLSGAQCSAGQRAAAPAHSDAMTHADHDAPVPAQHGSDKKSHDCENGSARCCVTAHACSLNFIARDSQSVPAVNSEEESSLFLRVLPAMFAVAVDTPPPRA